MKHIARNQITDIVANYQDDNFPAENLLDSKPGRKWSAGGVRINATLTLYISGGVSDLAIFGTNAQEATFTAEDPNGFVIGEGLDLGTGLVLADSLGTVTGTVQQVTRGNALWITLAEQVSTPCLFSLTLTSPGDQTLYAGVVIAGIAETYGGANFRYGAQQAMVDYSITAKNSNGSSYYKKRNIVRQYQLTSLMPREEADKLFRCFTELGAIPTAWKMHKDDSTTEDIIFGKCDPSRSHDYLNHDNINITITEEK